MKKGVIAISLLIAGGLLFTPIKNASFAKDMKDNAATAKVETTTEKTQSSNEAEDKTTQSEEVKQPIKEETTTQKETTIQKESTSQKETTAQEDTAVKEDVKAEESENKTTEAATNGNKEEQEYTGMTKSQAEQILDKYIEEVEQSDFTYTYQGDENTFDAIKEKGIRGYVFLPNLETDMAYLVDKDNGNIYFFHPSGYFDLLQ